MYRDYKLGKSYIRLSYKEDGDLVNYIQKLFSYHEVLEKNPTEIDCDIHITNQPFIDREISEELFAPSNVDLWYCKNGYIKQEEHFDYYLKIIDEKITIKIYPKENRSLKNYLKTFVLCGSFNVNDLIIPYLFSYKYFWMPLSIALLKKGCAFIHAGISGNDEKAILICGVGGSGKTSTTINLINKFGLKYLSEDFGIIDQDGIAYLSPRSLAIYKSDERNLSVQSKISFYKTFSFVNKLSWWLNIFLLGRNPIKRTFVKNAYSELNNNEECRVIASILMVSKLSKDSEIRRTDVQVIMQRSFSASVRELQDFYELESQITTLFGTQNKTIKYDILKKQMLDIYENFFTITNNYVFSCSDKMLPTEKAKTLIDTIDE